MTAQNRSVVAVICLCFCAASRSWAHLSSTWPFQGLAQAPVIATCLVEETRRDSLPAGAQRRVVTAHASLRVLRSFPQSEFAPGERIRVDYEALPEGDQGMSGPDVPQLKR
jgi:hypothetical protein